MTLLAIRNNAVGLHHSVSPYLPKSPTSVFTGFILTEVAGYAIKYAVDIYLNRTNPNAIEGLSSEPLRLQNRCWKDLSGALAGSILMGAATFNIMPYLSVVGTVAYVGYVLARYNKKDNYFSVQLIISFLKKIVVPGLDKLLNKIIKPLLKTIVKLLRKIPSLFSHPLWMAVVFLSMIFGLYRGVLAIAHHHPKAHK